jgi:hypothetical protein
MHMPQLHGTFEQTDFFIYTACDHYYFQDFGTTFINSVRSNTDYNIHMHLFNPLPEQIAFCQRQGVGVTWEHVHQPLFASAAQRWQTPPEQEPGSSQYKRTLTAMQKGQDSGLLSRMQKTYYACARFVRLAEFYKNHTVLAVDVDAIVRKPMPPMDLSHDFYLHRITGKRARYLAGGFWFNGSDSCSQFLKEYSQQLDVYFEQDYMYWGLDQDLLETIVPKFNPGQLPMSFIDWNMQAESYIWTAKGTRKESEVFVNEQKKYRI